MTEVEPEWDDHERAQALALLDVEADTCNGCGQPLSETTHPDAFDGYTATLPVVCQGCKAVDQQHQVYAKADDTYLHLNRYGVRRTWQPARNDQ